MSSGLDAISVVLSVGVMSVSAAAGPAGPAREAPAHRPPAGAAVEVAADVENPGFEGDGGWTGLVAGNAEYYAPVEGGRYAVLGRPGALLTQRTGTVVQPGMRYEVTVWARSIYDDAHTARLASPTYADLPVVGTSAIASARLSLGAAGDPIASTELDVSPRALLGDAATTGNDDGANVWVDGEFRVQFSDSILIQRISDDPITDPWRRLVDEDYDQDLAVGVVVIPGGRKLVLDCFYTDDPPVGEAWESLITLRSVRGSPPSYDWGPRRVVLFNERRNTGDPDDQLPWVIDAHAFWDADTERLWMSWGGHDLYVSELDPATGRPIDGAGNVVESDLGGLDPDVTDDPVHTMVVRERPEAALADPWRRSTYQEGPAIHEHGGYFYYFATYGNLAFDYTIRVGRSTDPRGPYLDREGESLLDGNGTILLGDDTEQLVPGHPHVWEESGASYLGYDYRTTRDQAEGEMDFMGIRRLHWVDGWPTIWRPVTVSFLSDDHPDAIGRRLEISIGNAGDPGSVLAVDRVTVGKAAAR